MTAGLKFGSRLSMKRPMTVASAPKSTVISKAMMT